MPRNPMDPEEIGSIAWHTREEIAMVLKGKGEDVSKTEMEGGESQQGSEHGTVEGPRKELQDFTALSEQCVLNGECMWPNIRPNLFSSNGKYSIHSGCWDIEAKSNRRASQSWSIPSSSVLHDSHSKDGHDGEDGASKINTVE